MSVVPSFAYSKTASLFHWAVAFPVMGCVGSVIKAQNSPKEEKGRLMFLHKSFGLLAAIIITPRVAYRLLSRSSYNVQKLQGNAAWENTAGSLGHVGLYGFMTIMPVTGIAMGYYSGKGLPFFYTTFAVSEGTINGAIAKQNYDIHKLVGTYGKFLIPLHAGAALFHAARGQAIFARMNPFRVPRA